MTYLHAWVWTSSNEPEVLKNHLDAVRLRFLEAVFLFYDQH